MSLRIRRGTDAQRSGITFDMGEIVWTTDGQQLWVGDGLTQGGSPVIGANVAGFGLAYDPTTRRLEVAGLSADNITNGVNNKFFATELAQDAAASLFVTGTHTNISFVYDDNLGKINATVALDGVGLTSIVADTTPELGGDLDLNLNDIIGSGNIDIVGDITVFGNIEFSSELSNDSISIVNNTIISLADNEPTNARIRLDTYFNILGNTVNTGDGNETTAVFNIFASSTTGNLKVLEDCPVYGQVVKAHTGANFVDSAALAFVTNGSITTGAPTAPMSLLVLLGNGTTTLDESAGQFSFNNNGSFIAPILQTGVYDTDDTDTRPTGVKGMIVFNDTTGKFQGYNGTAWVDLS